MAQGMPLYFAASVLFGALCGIASPRLGFVMIVIFMMSDLLTGRYI